MTTSQNNPEQQCLPLLIAQKLEYGTIALDPLAWQRPLKTHAGSHLQLTDVKGIETIVVGASIFVVRNDYFADHRVEASHPPRQNLPKVLLLCYLPIPSRILWRLTYFALAFFTRAQLDLLATHFFENRFNLSEKRNHDAFF